MNGYEVLTVELRGHASKLDGLADRLGLAVHAARTVSMDDGVYGLICQFLPGIMRGIEDQAYDALTASTQGMADISGQVRYTADEYERREDDAAVMFGGPL